MPQVYMRLKEWENAAKMSDYVYAKTGEQRYQEMSKYFRSQIGKENAGNITPKPPGPGGN